MRPLIRPQKKFEPTSDATKRFWDAVEKAKNTEVYEGQEVFHLTQSEAEKCRFEITEQSTRTATCTVHKGNFSHGIRMFPPHLYDIKNGIPYYKVNGKWIRWIPTIGENTKRIDSA